MSIDQKRTLRILHLGTESTWRGGENQVRLFIENSTNQVENFVAYPKKSAGYQRFCQISKKNFVAKTNVLPLPSSHPLDIRNYFALKNFCKKNKIDLIDAQSGNAHSMAIILKKIGLDIKLVVHRRVDNRIQQRLSTQKKYLSPKVDQFVAISGCIRQMLIDFGVNEKKISLVPSAVDEDIYKNLDAEKIKSEYRAKYNLAQHTLLLGNASAMTEQKGYDVLINALALLRDQDISFFALFAGDGHLRSAHEELVRQLNLTDHVQFLGHIQNVPEFLTALDVLAMPSNNEGLGSLILDAIFAGCAVVATRVGGIPEIIKHGDTGLLSEVGDEKGLARNLLRLADDKLFQQQLNEQGKRHLREQFSLNSMVMGNTNVYEKVIKSYM